MTAILNPTKPKLTFEEIESYVYNRLGWFELQIERLGWVNLSMSADDLQQEFLIHCMKYDIAGRYDNSSAAKTTYLITCMQGYTRQKFFLHHNRLKRNPANGSIKQLDVDRGEPRRRASCTNTGDRHPVDNMILVEMVQKLMDGLKDRGDYTKLKMLKVVVECNGDIKKAAESQNIKPWLVRRVLRRIAETPIGRIICKEMLD